MAEIDDIALPDANLNPTDIDTSTNQGKFIDLCRKTGDVWWRLCSKSGLTKTIAAFAAGVLGKSFPKLGPDWKPTKDITSVAVELGALPQNFANVRGDVAALRADVAALKASVPVAVNAAVKAALDGTPVTVAADNAAIASAVATELAARLKGA